MLYIVLYWTLFCTGHCIVLDIVLCCTLYCAVHCTVLDIVLHWTLYCAGHCTVLDIVLYWTLYCAGHCTVLDIVLCWTLYCAGHCAVLDIVMYWTLCCTGHCAVLDIVPYIVCDQLQWIYGNSIPLFIQGKIFRPLQINLYVCLGMNQIAQTIVHTCKSYALHGPHHKSKKRSNATTFECTNRTGYGSFVADCCVLY